MDLALLLIDASISDDVNFSYEKCDYLLLNFLSDFEGVLSFGSIVFRADL